MRISDSCRSLLPLFAVWLTALLVMISEQFPDPDLWGRLSIGALFFQNGEFPYHDVFSFITAGAPWIDHEWLTGVIFYQVLSLFGETGFLLFKYGSILAIFALIFAHHRKAYQADAAYAFYGLLILLPIYSLGFQATIRSQLFSFLFFVIFISLLESVRSQRLSRKHLLWLLPLGAIWANLHGGFITGILLLICYGLGEMGANRSWKSGWTYYVLAAGILALSAFINPYGPQYLSFLVHAWTFDRSHIPEWSPLDWSSWRFWPTQLLICAITVLMLWHVWARRRKNANISMMPLAPALVLLMTIAMALKGLRFQSFLAWAAVAYLPLLLPPAFLKRILPPGCAGFFRSQQSAFRSTLPLLALLCSISGLIFLHQSVNIFRLTVADELTRGAVAMRYPLGAVTYLRQSPYHGNLAVRFGWGEFVYWCLYPRFKVSMDGRYEEVYTQRQFMRNRYLMDNLNPFHASRALKAVNESPIDFILTEPRRFPLVSLLLSSPDWRLLYGDGSFLLFGKKTALGNGPVYRPSQQVLSDRIFTLDDFTTPQDMARFQLQ